MDSKSNFHSYSFGTSTTSLGAAGGAGGSINDADPSSTLISNSSIFEIAPIITLQFLFSPHGLDELASSAEATTLLRLGDTFTIVQRLALDGDPVHDERAEAYKKHPTVRVFRLTPPSDVAPKPLPLPALRVRGTGRTELNHWPAVRALREAILRAYPDHEAKELVTSIWINESYELLQQGVDALGESRDTSYLSTESFVLPEEPDAFVVVYGVNHAASGKAVYSNVVAYGEAKDNGVASLSSREMAGSAGRYLPRADASALYAVTVSRFQGAAPCLKVPLPPPGHALHGILPSEAMYLGFRAYLEPETMVGPAWQEMVFDRAILFARKRR